MRRWIWCLAVLTLSSGGQNVLAGDNPFLGQWTIQSNMLAPWADTALTDRSNQSDLYLESEVTIAPDDMSGPGLFACSKPAYIVEPLPADIVFQGGLAVDPQSPTSDPDDIKAMEAAAKLGLDRINIPTLENRCSDLALHMADANTVYFAADNRIYTMKRKLK